MKSILMRAAAILCTVALVAGYAPAAFAMDGTDDTAGLGVTSEEKVKANSEEKEEEEEKKEEIVEGSKNQDDKDIDDEEDKKVQDQDDENDKKVQDNKEEEEEEEKRVNKEDQDDQKNPDSEKDQKDQVVQKDQSDYSASDSETHQEKVEKKNTVNKAPADSEKNSDKDASEPEQPAKKTEQQKKDGKVSAFAVGEMIFELDSYTYTYQRKRITPTPVNVMVKKDDVWTSLKSTEYTVAYKDNFDAGKATIIVTGKKGTEYEGCSLSKTFTIKKANQKLTVTANRPRVKCKRRGRLKVVGKKGKLTFTSSDRKVLAVNQQGVYRGKTSGSAVITIKAAATNNYNPTTKKIRIRVVGNKLTASNSKIKLSRKKFTYTGERRKPKITVTYKGKLLKKGRDYKTIFRNHINAGTAEVVVRGIGLYEGARKKHYTIEKAENTMTATINKDRIDLDEQAVIKVRNAIGPVTFKSSDTGVATVTKQGVVKARGQGKVTITVRAGGNNNYKIKKERFKLRVGYRSLKDKECKISLYPSSYTYDGSRKTPEVTVTYDGEELNYNSDYTLSYSNNKNAGTAKVVVKGKGYYSDKRTLNFKIYKAEQTDFKVYVSDAKINLGDTIQITSTGAIGSVTYRSNSPSYLKSLGGGKFKATKRTVNYVTITVTSTGNKNYKSKSYSVKVSIN